MSLTPAVDNVLSVYNRASVANWIDGMEWYDDAHAFSQSAAFEFGLSVAQTAGVTAALSPMMNWDANKAQALLAFQHGTAMGLGLDRNCVKACRILDGENPLTVLGGNKVRAFYSTILDPSDSNIDPVIDRHAFDIAIGRVTDDVTRGILGRKGKYHEFALVYREAASIVGCGAAQMQAITWMQWRQEKKNV